MKINVAQIRQAIGGRQSFRFNCPVSALDSKDNHCWLNGNIEVFGEVINNGHLLHVEGRIKGLARLICNRCLKEFDYPVDIIFSENYREAEDCAVRENDDGEVLFCEDEIDIGEPVRETVLLAEPLNAACSESCRGLCGVCGADLNTAPCSCDKDSIDPRLAALQKLLKK